MDEEDSGRVAGEHLVRNGTEDRVGGAASSTPTADREGELSVVHNSIFECDLLTSLLQGCDGH